MRTTTNEALDYIKKTFTQETQKREEILKAIQKNGKEGIQISAVEGQLLKVLAKMVQAQKVVEVGTLLGYSTTWLLEAVGERGKVWSFEKSQENYKIVSDLLKDEIQSERLNLHQGDAKEELKKITSQGPFDLVFIDANKSAYMDYYKWADQNLRVGGLIVADNTFLFGQVYSEQEPEKNKKAWEAMRSLNQSLAQSPNYESILIPTAEGLTIAYKVNPRN